MNGMAVSNSHAGTALRLVRPTEASQGSRVEGQLQLAVMVTIGYYAVRRVLAPRMASREVEAPDPSRPQAHTSYVSSVSFSPDGKRIVSGSSEKTVKVWDAESGQHEE